MGLSDIAKRILNAIWPYIVLFMAALSHAASAGFHYGMLGSFTVAQKKYYVISIHESSWTGAVHLATFLFMSPIVGVLSKVIPLRFIQIIGGFTIFVGIGLCFILTEIWQVVLSFGVVAGCGMALVRTASDGILPYHFNKETISFARACLLIGMTLGMAAFPLLLNYLFDKYGFPYTMLAISILMLVHIVSGLTYSQKPNKLRGVDHLVENRKTSGEICRALSPTLIQNSKVWVYLLAALFRKFGLTSFYILLTYYLVENHLLTTDDVAHGRMTLGCASAVGVVGVGVSHYLKYDRLIIHMVAPMVSGLAIFLITGVEYDVSFSMLMGLFGLSYGVYIANILGALVRILRGGEEINLMFKLVMYIEAVGALGGAPVISYIQEKLSLETGMYFAGAFCILSGLCIMTIFISECTQNSHDDSRKKKDYVHINTYSPTEMDYTTMLQQSANDTQPLLSTDDETVPLNVQSTFTQESQ